MRLLVISLCVVLALVSCQRRPQCEEPQHSIASLNNIATQNLTVPIIGNITLRGTITANNICGEFYNTLIVEDATAAVRILCELEHSQEDFHINSRVTISCCGLYLNKNFGELTLGAAPQSEQRLNAIPQSQLGVYLKREESSALHFTPQQVNIAQLTPLHILRLVHLSKVTITNDEGVSTFCSYDPATGKAQDTHHRITDSNGDSATLYVNRQCHYGGQRLPADEIDILAIVGYFNGEYMLTISNGGF